MMKWSVNLFVVMVLLSIVGCGGKADNRMTVYPVSGKLLFRGKPAARAELTLRPVKPFTEPAGRSVLPSARVNSDGTFRFTTYLPDDGAPAGDYLVTVVWPVITIEGGEETIGPDRLQGRYSRPEQPAAKATIQAGTNELPVIDLK